MSLLPIALRITIDEDANIAFQVEEGKRLTAWHLWTLATFIDKTASDLHARDQEAMKAASGGPLVVARGLPGNGRG